MRTTYGFCIICFLLFSSFFILKQSDGPENLLSGTWQEVEWEYERINHINDREDLIISGEQKKEICQQLVIHSDPHWKFIPEKRLLKIGDQEQLTWNIKGRGHILELIGNKGTENYQIVELTDDKLVLYFNFDLQIRGIIKMTFQRIG